MKSFNQFLQSVDETTRPDLEHPSYTRARELNDAGKKKSEPMDVQVKKWKAKNKGKDPLTGQYKDKDPLTGQ